MTQERRLREIRDELKRIANALDAIREILEDYA